MRTPPLLLVALLALPAVTALPALCGSDCRIAASTFPGYDPPLAVLASGSTVTFHSTDIQHVTRDSGVGSPRCFLVGHEGGQDSPPVRFDIVGGALVATAQGESAVCGSAVGDGAGGYALQYFCVLHPLMRGGLVVTG